MKQSHITLIALVLIAGALLAAVLLKPQSQQDATVSQGGAQLIREHSPRVGPEQAKVTIVEFMDPACGTCRQFHPYVKRMLQRYPDQIRVVLRYAPFHQGSDGMVAILEAARKQNKFGQVLDLMFDTQSQWTQNHIAYPDRFWPFLDALELDLDRLAQDMKAPEIVHIIQQDLSDARQLGADKTPTFFVNGRALPSFGLQQLTQLVEAEIAKHYP
ncbi:hypothetical protein Tel_09220 [Candidatus Tenderia electrophaga]|jgi:protein-disulfide isomerase|uniref:Thioredoxin domain-containing protein n=1 Tax=Candidatus Tenderia electrophaga TaxID=1748243 RepID=A0A0S2TDW3_9GAMM|nr:hypothetical protein Tel_09220 [Candidatus Tenderia electrophaga]